MFIVGVSGKARSGKDTAADAALTVLNESGIGKWEKDSFARPVKKLVSAAFGIPLPALERHKAEKTKPDGWKKNVRDAYIHVGDGFRSFDEDVWVKNFAKRRGIRSKISEPGRVSLGSSNVVVTDVRYRNEAEWINSVGGIVVRVHRPAHDEGILNPSENDLDSATEEILASGVRGPTTDRLFSYLIINDGTLEDLVFEASEVFAKFVVDRFKFMIA